MQNLRISLTYSDLAAFDIDITAFMLANDKYIPNENYMVYYHNLVSADGAVKYLAEKQAGLQTKFFDIDLSKVATEIEEIYLVVSLYEAASRNQCFGKVPNIQVNLVDLDTGKTLNTYHIATSFAHETSVELGRLFVRYGKWRWETLSVGYQEGLEKFVNKYVF